MNSMRLTAVPESIIEQAYPEKNLFDLIVANDQLYRTSFEHSWDKHLKFLEQQRLSHLTSNSSRFAQGVRTIEPKWIYNFAHALNHTDLNQLEKKAHQVLGERYDAHNFMSIVKHRLIPIVNYAADHAYYLVIDHG